MAAQPHARCAASPVRRTRQAGIDWVVARFACAGARPVIVEAAGVHARSAAMVYAQLAPVAGTSDRAVDELLAGIVVD